MKKTFLTLAFACICLVVAAQTTTDAFAKYEAKEYKASGEMYDKALKADKGTATDYYNAACSWALAGNKEKAFSYLTKAADKGWHNVEHLQQDSDLSSLHNDKRWQKVVAQVQATKEKKEANYNKPLMAQLEQVFDTDQKYRRMIDSVRTNYGTESREWTALIDTMEAVDHRNLKTVTAIIDEYGWPGTSLVGGKANMAVFLVIQHSDLATQEKYFPAMRASAEKGESSKANLALLEDRILTGNNKPQKYGSQLRLNPDTNQYEFFPIEDEANIDKRRAEMGLGPLKEYAKRFGIDYTLPKAQ